MEDPLRGGPVPEPGDGKPTGTADSPVSNGGTLSLQGSSRHGAEMRGFHCDLGAQGRSCHM
jgi:hypothetical protein